MGAEPTGTIRLVWPFRRVASELGSEPSEPWEQAGLESKRLEDPDARVSNRVLNELLEAAVERSGRADLGLLAAEQLQPGDLDLFELVARSRSTLGDALACIPRLLPLLHDSWELAVSEQGGMTEARFGLKEGAVALPASSDFLLAAAVVSMRRATGNPQLRIHEVHFPQPAPVDLTSHGRIFDATLHFEQPSPALRFSSDVLSLPLVHASPTVSAALEKVAAELLSAGRGPEGFTTRVVSTIDEQLSSGHACSAASVAKKLGVTVRTLQRRLDEEGTGFRTVLDEHRAQLAHAYLTRPDISVAEVAYLLGFATTQAFHRAFKRWSGQTPAALRSAANPVG